MSSSSALLLCIAALVSGLACSRHRTPDGGDDSVSWLFDNLRSVNGHIPRVLGNPIPTRLEPGVALCFNGVDDGLIFDENPLQGRAAFTLEVLFRPDAAGPAAQRFVHIQESNSESRALIETRVTRDSFYLDTFLSSKDAKATLADPALSHPTSSFHWAALSYSAGRMRQFMDGAQELEATLAFTPLGPGQMSVGVRLNQKFWFKGCIREVRFTPRALPAAQLRTLRAH
jgi:hypothetical protein